MFSIVCGFVRLCLYVCVFVRVLVCVGDVVACVCVCAGIRVIGCVAVRVCLC